jgi:hypothetical protein
MAVERLLRQVGATTRRVARETGTAVGTAAAGAARSVGEGVKDIATGAAKIARRDYAGVADLGRGSVKLLHPIVSVPATIGAGVYGAVIEAGRGLTDDEQAMLRAVFGDSVDYRAVVVKPTVKGIGGRGFTIANTIHLARDTSAVTLVHEMVHVWQFQNGGTDYIAASAFHQAGVFRDVYAGDAYDWRPQVKAGKRWAALGAEQQAQLVEDAYAEGHFAGDTAWSHAAYMDLCLVEIRGRRGAA